MSEESFTITDNRSGESVTVPIVDGTISSAALRELDKGMWFYDPAYMSTANCNSKITYIDGGNGILRYRGYPIEQLAEHSNFLEVCYLLLNGELPTEAEAEEWVHHITMHTYVHEDIAQFMKGLRYDAHPMGTLVSTVAALSTFYPEAKNISDPHNRLIQTHRLIAKMPTMAAFAYKNRLGLPYEYPVNHLGYTGNFLRMMWNVADPAYEPDPILTRALDILLILHADHEQNCSTTTMRTVGSSNADPYSAVAAATCGLYGPLHGGANEAVMHMMKEIKKPEKAKTWIENALAKKKVIMGFGHRVYRTGDSRVPTMKHYMFKVAKLLKKEKYTQMYEILEKAMLEKKNIHPNVDFPCGPTYYMMGIDIDFYTPIFVMSRITGWSAHIMEQHASNKLIRPLSKYKGQEVREVMLLNQR